MPGRRCPRGRLGTYLGSYVLGEGMDDASGPHVKRHGGGLGHGARQRQCRGHQEQRGPEGSAGRRHLGSGPLRRRPPTGRGEGHVERPTRNGSSRYSDAHVPALSAMLEWGTIRHVMPDGASDWWSWMNGENSCRCCRDTICLFPAQVRVPYIKMPDVIVIRVKKLFRYFYIYILFKWTPGLHLSGSMGIDCVLFC